MRTLLLLLAWSLPAEAQLRLQHVEQPNDLLLYVTWVGADGRVATDARLVDLADQSLGIARPSRAVTAVAEEIANPYVFRTPEVRADQCVAVRVDRQISNRLCLPMPSWTARRGR